MIGWPVCWSVPERGPVAFALDLLVGDRALDDQHERVEPALLGLVPGLHELVAVLVGQHRVVQVDLGQPGDRSQDHVLDARLGGGGDRDRVAVAAQPGRDPEDVHLLDGGCPLRFSSVGNCRFGHGPLSFLAGSLLARHGPAALGLHQYSVKIARSDSPCPRSWAWPYLIRATKNTPPNVFPSVAQSGKRSISSMLMPCPENAAAQHFDRSQDHVVQVGKANTRNFHPRIINRSSEVALLPAWRRLARRRSATAS